jgi:hypothetical protein
MVVPNLLHEIEAIDYCKRVFDVFNIKARGSAKKSPEKFRFDATRLYGRLTRPTGGDVGEGTTIFDVTFEVQVRTAFEHAWIVSMHPLTYKTPNVDWKRFRLAAQLKAGVEQLDLSVLQFESLSAAITEAPWPDIAQRQSVAQLVTRLVNEGVVPTEAGPKDMSRFADNFIDMTRASKRKMTLEDALVALEAGLRGFDAGSFPRSASLLQICMAILFSDGLLSGPLQRYACHITPELRAIFPGIEVLTPVFRYRNVDGGK